MKIYDSTEHLLILICDLCFKETRKKLMSDHIILDLLLQEMGYYQVTVMIGNPDKMIRTELCSKCTYKFSSGFNLPNHTEKVMNKPIHKLNYISKKLEYEERGYELLWS